MLTIWSGWPMSWIACPTRAGIVRFTAGLDPALRERIGLARSIPRTCTLACLLTRLDGDALDQALGAWVQLQHHGPLSAPDPENDLVKREAVAVDGKTARGSRTRDRILRPLGLRHTDIPGTRPFLPQPHAANYQQFAPDGPMVDTTIPYRPFDLGADGSMTGTARDLNRFFTALTRGRLLKPATLATMRATVPMPRDSDHPVGTRSGLGLFFTPLSCGGGYLGHGGSGFGYLVRAATTTDGRRSITVSTHSRPGDPDTADRQENALRKLVDHALCHPG